MWDVNAGVAPMRNTLHPNSLSLPNYHPYHSLLFIERGEGIIGLHFPGCAETFDRGSQQQQSPRGGQSERGQEEHDNHQKVHRFRQGDIIAIPAGAVHWTFNDGNEEVFAISINDLSNPANQLDMQLTPFYLAGAASTQSMQGMGNIKNIYSGFDTELLAEAFNVDPEIVKQMQQGQKQLGLVVRVEKRMQMVKPDEEQGQWNGLEETMCSAKILYNLDNQREADFFSRQAGKMNVVNQYKLPILSHMDLSAEKGKLLPNAMFTPHWLMNSRAVLYVLRGDAQVQIVSNSGQTVFDQRVNRGEMFVVPQFFVGTARAGENGLEWVVFKTNRSPMMSPLAGYTSVFRAMPLEVITNAYRVSPSQAQNLKTARGAETYLLSPKSKTRY